MERHGCPKQMMMGAIDACPQGDAVPKGMPVPKRDGWLGWVSLGYGWLGWVSLGYGYRGWVSLGYRGWVSLEPAVPRWIADGCPQNRRGVHHFAGVPFTIGALAGSAIFQAGLSLVWGAAGLAGMVAGAIRERREIWIGGVIVMGIAILKLFVVELGNVGTLARVVSFLGVGLLLLIVGYFAPVPKGRSEAEDAEAPAAPTET